MGRDDGEDEECSKGIDFGVLILDLSIMRRSGVSMIRCWSIGVMNWQEIEEDRHLEDRRNRGGIRNESMSSSEFLG